jgi:hypothetical protein
MRRLLSRLFTPPPAAGTTRIDSVFRIERLGADMARCQSSRS